MTLLRVITPGGCGSRAVKSFLRERCGCHMPDGWQTHERNPKTLSLNRTTPLVYLYANPCDTLLSFARRGFLNNESHIRNIRGRVEEFKKANGVKTVEGYLKNGIDYFDLRDHFFSYYRLAVPPQKGEVGASYQSRLPCPICFIRYESLPESMPKLLAFLGLPPGKAEVFDYKPRQSDWEQVPVATQQMMAKMYGGYLDFLEDVPDFLVFQP